ncbi:GTP cyclohydrolase II [Teichococcus vastitatis]|uniref:GTP cyclohydrolase II n=1 Tax=Teichococcus vastitatis TaxID=2307076 RepID=A0ABS9WBI1_9PROT|nr:GTP cyclohydrolase II [Pseudoroseomonas vastitatis]MCI0755964.1 GTP cyclohydrolase II [Pseudoroseomonas vastitatis]
MTGLNRLRDGKGIVPKPIILTSHPQRRPAATPPLAWGAADPLARGPVIATLADPAARNAIGTHAGSYALYRALAVASGQLRADHRPDFRNTRPAVPVGPFPAWGDPGKIVSLDPWGHLVPEVFADAMAAGQDIRPSIAVTRAHINMPELMQAMRDGRLLPDGEVLLGNGDVRVTKIAIEPVWFLPGVAARFGIGETELRRDLFEQTGGMFPELVTRPDLRVFLPPIGGMTVYLFGEPSKLGLPHTQVACRIHDECNGSDVFGSDICTCRPYLAHGIEACIGMAQEGGVGVIVYNRKEGRALGEVTKFLVYNARKRQEGGDRADQYFQRTECVAGVQDMRFQELMPDVLHWLGITRIDRLVSMSNMKFAPIIESGIEVISRVPIPDALIPADAQVEMDAKKAAGYFTEAVPDAAELAIAKGRAL